MDVEKAQDGKRHFSELQINAWVEYQHCSSTEHKADLRM